MRRLSFSAILLCCCLMLAPTVWAEVVDRIVAVVNDDVITLSELNEEGNAYFETLIKRVSAKQLQDEMPKLKQEVLSQMIDQRLIEQHAAKLEIKISDDEVNQTITTMLTDNNATREDLKKDLARKGMSEEQYKKQLRNQMLQSRLIGREVRSKVVVTDEMVKKYYTANYTATKGATGYHILQMGFLWGDEQKQKSAAEAKQAAEQAKAQLDDGKTFAEVAGEMSDLPSKVDGGDIGVFQQDELAPFMKDIILAMKPGNVSSIIETPNGYQILKLVSILDGEQLSAAIPANIKKEIETKLYQQEGEELYKKWVSELRTQAFIKQNL